MTHSTRTLAAGIALAVALTACEPPAPEESGAATEVTGSEQTARAPIKFTATEYAYDGPQSVPAGMTEVQFANEGVDSHALLMVGFPDDKTIEDVMAALETEQITPWMSFPGGIGGIPGGTRTSATLNLTAGNYALLSFESAPGEDIPDVMRGMLASLTVTPSEIPGAAPPDADVTVGLADYSFAADTTLAAGSYVFEVVNNGTENHEAVIMRLAEGLTAADFVEMSSAPPESDDAAAGSDDTTDAEGTPVDSEEEGPAFDGPPVTSAGGMGPLDPGATGFVSVDLEPGNYMYICFIPNAEGVPHMVLGMFHEFSVE